MVEHKAYYPLFAALVGNSIRLGENFTKWNRRQLIDYYLSGSDRIPWEHKEGAETGRWASYFIAVATSRGKICYDDLKKAAGNHLKHINDVKKICQKVTTDKDENYLKPFEPDILGESFFLKLLQYIYGSYEFPNEFRQLFMAGDEKTQTKDAIEFIGFIQRLTRNLLNDDQKDVEPLWEVLFEFLNPSDFETSEPLKLAVAAGLLDLVEAIKDRFSAEEISALLKKIKPDIFYHIKNDDLLEKSVIYCMQYFELSNRFLRITPKLPNQMVELFKRYTTPYNDEIDIQYLPLFVAIHCRFTKVINALIDNKIGSRLAEIIC